jgi:kynurenine formamidase
MRKRGPRVLLVPLLLGTIAAGCAARTGPAAVAIDASKVVDLSHAFDSHTVYWPTARPFELSRVAFGRTAEGYWYAANDLCMAEHGGTHMDAPIHFAEAGHATEEVPVTAGIGPAVVIDVRAQAVEDPDYRLGVDDILAWEKRHGRLPRGAIVIMWSGWGAFWPDKKRYLGSDVPGDAANLHFPAFSKQAATFLVEERDIAAVAVDTASIDHGPSRDFIVHQIINGANKPGFENLANVDRLPPVGATIIALPIKIAGGSGAPARVVAILP